MKKAIINQIEKEIEQKIKIPNDKKDKLLKYSIENLLLGIIIVEIFLYYILGINFVEIQTFQLICKISSILILILSLTILEIAYKKDNSYLALNGLEILFLAFSLLFTSYFLTEGKTKTKANIIVIGIYIIIYYFAKVIINYVCEKKKIMKENSDIKELIDKKDKDLIKEEKEKNSKRERKTLNTKKSISNNNTKKTKRKENTNKQDNKEKKADKEQIKKETTKDNIKKEGKDIQNDKEQKVPKKRGRPKKIV